MKPSKHILLGIGCIALLIISWVAVAGAQSASDKQLMLMSDAAALIQDGIYITAVPLLEEAAGYDAEHTLAAEDELKKAYLALIDRRGFRRKYLNLLDKQMGRKDANHDVFAEAANYYLGISRLPEAFRVLKAGIEKTHSETLAAIYEDSRYVYEINRSVYDYAASIHDGASQVRSEGLWGLASANGNPLIPCRYDKISTFSGDRAVVRQGGEVFAVDKDNNRVAKLHGHASDFGNFADDRIPLFLEGGWRRSTGDFALGSTAFEQIGMYSAGYAPAKTGGKWGVVGMSANWLIPPEYDEIVQDELGRCYARGAVFARLGNEIHLFVDGERAGRVYEGARPFSDEGYAAVMQGGKWGYIDILGNQAIDFVFDDALSFGQHLAAVKIGDLWGYVGLHGRMAIQPGFLEAKSFSGGSAPVLTEQGWQFITLIEYKRAPIGLGL